MTPELVVTVAEAVAAARRRLEAAGVPSPAVDARRLVLHVLGWSPAELVTRAGEPLGPAASADLAGLVARRSDRVPLQVLLGSWAFRRVELVLRPGVFVPRPETELLVGLALDAAPAGGLVVEPCTGSGAIAAALADERPDLRVIATDVDPAAASLARRNTAAWAERVDVLAGDLLEPVDRRLRGRVDVLVSNPPYLSADELEGLEPEVRCGDPGRALVAGPSGHEVSDRLIAAAPAWLAPGGWLLLEIDPSRAGATARRCAAAGLVDVATVADLTGRHRFVRAARPDATGTRRRAAADGSAATV